MLYTMIQKNSYMDSVELMVLSKRLGNYEGVQEATVMMGTAANLAIMEKGGFGSEKLKEARPNDIVIAVKADKEEVVDGVMQEVQNTLKGKKKESLGKSGERSIKSWK